MMANLMDYLDWRGDLTFEQAPFNEVDNLILAQLVYVEFEGIVPTPGKDGTVTVREASEQFFRTDYEACLHDENSGVCVEKDGTDSPFCFGRIIWLCQ